jgi:hypothetical protein
MLVWNRLGLFTPTDILNSPPWLRTVVVTTIVLILPTAAITNVSTDHASNFSFILLLEESSSYKSSFYRNRELHDGQEGNETTRVDCRAGPYFKNDGSPKKARITYWQNAQAHRRRDAAKGIYYWAVARLEGLSF